MVQPLRAALPAIRHTTAVLRPASQRSMISAAALPAHEVHPTPLDLNILDIFDAPARLGESSKLLARAAAASRRAISTAAVRPAAPRAGSRRVAVKPLPAPTMLDGPARPRSMSFVSFRRFNQPRPAVPGASVRPLPEPLPSPILFDGPSQLRPYVRGGSPGGSVGCLIVFRARGPITDHRGCHPQASSLAKSAMPLALALAAAVVIFGVDVAPQENERRPGQVA